MVHGNTLSLVTLMKDGHVGVLQGKNLLFVTVPLTLKILRNLLLKNQSIESIAKSFLGARKVDGKAGRIILLLVVWVGRGSLV
jgi:hypothetical protein